MWPGHKAIRRSQKEYLKVNCCNLIKDRQAAVQLHHGRVYNAQCIVQIFPAAIRGMQPGSKIEITRRPLWELTEIVVEYKAAQNIDGTSVFPYISPFYERTSYPCHRRRKNTKDSQLIFFHKNSAETRREFLLPLSDMNLFNK